jgi:hypothetical protein
MFRRVAHVALMAGLLAAGLPGYSAAAAGKPSLQSDDAILLVRHGERWRGDWGYRGWRRGDDGWRFRDDGWRGRDWRAFRHHRYLDDFGPLFGFGQRHFFGPRYSYFDDGYGHRRRRAPWW